MTTKEKKDIILQFLYDHRNESKFHDLNTEIASNYTEITGDDISEIANSAERQGFLRVQKTKWGVLARMTAEGYEYVENLYQYRPTDKINPDEQEILKAKVDELLERLKRLESGQQMIYDDLEAELQQLKKLVSVLGKNDWRQMLLGKLIDAGLGSVAGEVMKAIVATFPNQNFLN